MIVRFKDEAGLHRNVIADIANAGYSGQATIEAFIEIPHNKTARVMTDGSGKRMPFAQVFPLGMHEYQQVHVQIGPDYERIVQKRREALGIPGDFNARALPWGEWEIAPYVIVHTPKDTGVRGWYLRYYIDMSANSRYDQHVYVDKTGTLLAPSQADLFWIEFAKEKKPSGTQGLPPEAEVQPRSMKFLSIMKLTANNNTYVRESYALNK